MEYAKNFENIIEQIISKFHDLDAFYLCVHILGYVSGFDKRAFVSSTSTPILPFIDFNKDLIKKIEDAFPVSISEFSVEEKRGLCRFLLEICIHFEREIKQPPDNYDVFFDKLLISEPKAINKHNNDYNILFDLLSTESQEKFFEWEIERYFYSKIPVIPQYVSKKLVDLAKPEDGHTIYDPNCNNGEIFVEFYERFSNLHLNFRGVVRNQFEWLFSFVNLYVNGVLDDKKINFEIELASPFQDNPLWFYEFKTGDYTADIPSADIVISVVPFAELVNENTLDPVFFGLTHSISTSEYPYIELMLNATSRNGKTIAIVPNYILNSSESRYVRDAYLSRDLIERVVSLDKFDFNLDAYADTSIIVFDKNKPNINTVLFESEIGNKEVKTSVIKSDYDSCLNVNFFLDVKKQLEYIAEAFSAEFPDLAPFRYLYIIAGITGKLASKQFLSFFPTILLSRFFHRESAYQQKHGKGIDSLITTNIFSRNQVKEAVEYLISGGVFHNSDGLFPISPRSWDEIIDDLAKREPDAVQIETTQSGEKIESVDWGKLSYSALNEFTRREIHSALQNSQYLFPSKELERTLVELAAPRKEQIIYNANCGVGSIFVEFEKQYPNHNLKYYGVLSDKFSELLCEANLYINGINAEINSEGLYNQTLSFNEELSIWEGVKSDNISFYDEDSSEWQSTNIVDIAVGIPEFKERVYLGKYKPLEMLSRKEFTRNEYALVDEMLSRLNETGKTIVVVPNNFLSSLHVKSYRQKYLSLDLIEKIISLPDDTFKPHDAIKTSIVVFNKNKTEKGFITFKSADSQFETTKISLDEILSSDRLDLRVSRYASAEIKELKSILSKYPQDEVKRIKDLIDSSISGYNYSPDNRIAENSSENLPYVRVKDLSNSSKDFTLDLSKVERVISREKARKKTVIDFSAVLVSKIAPKLKPTLFNFAGQPIVIGSDVVALKVKEGVNVEYFLTQLYSQLVKIQVEMLSSGNTINRISIQDFLDIQIVLPPLEDQQRQILEMRGLIAEKKSVEEKIVEAQFEVVASINHSLKNKLAVVINDYDTLLRFLRRKERKSETIIFSDAISANAVGDDIDTIEIITNRLKTNLSDASKVFNNALKIQRQNLKKDVVELVKFFKEEVKPLYAGKNFSIEVNVKPNLKLNVWLDKDAFKDVIENLIENAKSHGFINDEKNYRIVFDLSKLKDEDDFDGNTSTKYARIVYKNDGKTFPQNFSFEDYKQFSNKAGKTQGTGIGGYVINKMIELHDGRFNFIYPSDDFTVGFEILLPLEN